MTQVKARFVVSNEGDDGESLRLLVSDLQGAVVQTMEPDSTRLLERYSASDVKLTELPPDDSGRMSWELTIPAEWINRGGATAIMTILVANALEFGGPRLQAVELPESVLSHASGPRLGVAGVRRMLLHSDGPLFGVPIKPNTGLTLREKMEVAEALAAAGVDFVKDDEIFFADPQEIAEHSAAIQKCIDVYQTPTRRPCYVPNVSGAPITDDHVSQLASRGVRGIMICFLTSGWNRTLQLSQRYGESMIIYGHRALHEALMPYVSMQVLALLARLSGVDVVHVGTPRPGRLGELAEARAAVGALTSAHPALKGTIPVFSKTTGPLGRWLVRTFGDNIVVMACGEVYGEPDLRRAASEWIREVNG